MTADDSSFSPSAAYLTSCTRALPEVLRRTGQASAPPSSTWTLRSARSGKQPRTTSSPAPERLILLRESAPAKPVKQ